MISFEELRKQPLYFDRKGNAIGLMDWVEKIEDKEYAIVKQDNVGKYFVSTVWLGLNHSYYFFKDAPIQIFETMIFIRDGEPDNEEDPIKHYIERYSTEEEAIAGHVFALRIAKGEILIE